MSAPRAVGQAGREESCLRSAQESLSPATPRQWLAPPTVRPARAQRRRSNPSRPISAGAAWSTRWWRPAASRSTSRPHPCCRATSSAAPGAPSRALWRVAAIPSHSIAPTATATPSCARTAWWPTPPRRPPPHHPRRPRLDHLEAPVAQVHGERRPAGPRGRSRGAVGRQRRGGEGPTRTCLSKTWSHLLRRALGV
jgi:hypothetical protein